MSSAKYLPLAALAAIAVFSHAADAQACAAMCSSPKLAPATGATVPSSAPGLPVFGGAASADDIQLETAGGALVAGTFAKDPISSLTYFLPATTLAPGEYKSTSKSECGGDVISTFTVGAASALPVATGALAVKRAFREKVEVSTSSGSCTEEADAAMVDLDLTVDAALASYLPIAYWQTKVDGNWWSGQYAGSLSADEGLGHSLLRLFTACDGLKPAGRHPGLVAGAHDVTVQAVLAGGQALAPATIRVNVTCGPDNGTVTGIGDGEISGGGGGDTEGDGTGGPGGRTSRPPSSGTGSGASGPSGQDGCAAVPRTTSSSTNIVAAALGLLALAGLRRRRNTVD